MRRLPLAPAAGSARAEHVRQQAGWGAEAWANISLGQLAIGFSLGLVRLPLLAVITAIACGSCWPRSSGSPGAGLSERLRERAGQLAGVAVILPASRLMTAQLRRLARPAPAAR